eukprot:15431908-Alexandrium_andersonii.AAC.1
MQFVFEIDEVVLFLGIVSVGVFLGAPCNREDPQDPVVLDPDIHGPSEPDFAEEHGEADVVSAIPDACSEGEADVVNATPGESSGREADDVNAIPGESSGGEADDVNAIP